MFVDDVAAAAAGCCGSGWTGEMQQQIAVNHVEDAVGEDKLLFDATT